MAGISVENLRHAFDGRTILSMDAWRVESGEAALILGPSGCGKSTLVHILAGLLTPDAGTVRIADTDVHTLSGSALDAFRGAHIGIVLQDLHLIPAISVRDNLRLALRLAGADEDGDRIDALLERLALSHRASARPRALSRGEAQRAAIARAVVARPSVVLADEPTSALDDANAERVIALLKDEAAAVGATVVTATHDHRVKAAFDARLELEAPA